MGLKLLTVLTALFAIGIYAFYFAYFCAESDPPNVPARQYFGKGKQRDDDPKIRSFKVSVSDVVLEDLKSRLENARIGHEQLEDVADFEYGFNLNTLLAYRDYWLKSYDWRKHEATLNAFPQFITEIEGIKIHFLHVKPPTGKYKKTVPLVLVHGWPGNVFEFHKIIALLTDPAAHAATQRHAQFAFEVVAPSIPGYGWSEQPHKRGFSQVSAARIFKKLMVDRLGFAKFVAQGGDWGSLVVLNMARLYAQHMHGVHTNSAFMKVDSAANIARGIVGGFAPRLAYSKPETKWTLSGFLLEVVKETGYMHIQATKPDTVGVGLNDSPIGLMAYILEKFSTWTNNKNRLEADGGLEKKYSKDELLTVVMIYWTNGNILSSQRFYREFFLDENVKKLENVFITVPTGIASLPYDLVERPPYEMIASGKNLTHYTEFADGGHFAAFELPRELAADVFKFVKSLQI